MAEQEIVNATLAASEVGFGISKSQLLHKTGLLCTKKGFKTPFTDGKPGKDWWRGYTKRHPEVTLRKPEPLSSVWSRNMNPRIVGHYFIAFHKILNKFEGKPHLVWNADETSICFEHQPVKVCARVGMNNVPERVSDSRESLTMMGCINAAGTTLAPLLNTKEKPDGALLHL